ncbi:MAG: hypothetical protein ACFFC7_14035 [Candidatus Hermodarchaeota archaeon]
MSATSIKELAGAIFNMKKLNYRHENLGLSNKGFTILIRDERIFKK